MNKGKRASLAMLIMACIMFGVSWIPPRSTTLDIISHVWLIGAIIMAYLSSKEDK
jgi:hypothetical protein